MNIGVVIVTYNRLKKLRKCLAAYEAQTFLPSVILVFNNFSTDGTKEYLNQWEAASTSPIKKIIIHSPENLGGAGGFAEGIRQMLDQNTDWIWLADDDAYPDINCLETIMTYYTKLKPEEQTQITAISTKVVDCHRKLSAVHRRKLRKGLLTIQELPLTEQDFEQKDQEIDLFSFVGTLIRTSVVQSIGFPRSDYFIFFDDSEYSLRVRNKGKIMCLSDAIIVHDSLENLLIKESWKNYYMFRNKLYTYLLHFPKHYTLTEICKILLMILRHYNCRLSWQQFRHALRDVHLKRMGKETSYLPSIK